MKEFEKENKLSSERANKSSVAEMAKAGEKRWRGNAKTTKLRLKGNGHTLNTFF